MVMPELTSGLTGREGGTLLVCAALFVYAVGWLVM